jgi:HD-GYP domain-containing protein (c-di-GMP phosphodiesterase class II)
MSQRQASLTPLGKIVVPDAILHKPGPLAEVEILQLREHPPNGKNILGNIDYLKQAIPCVLSSS